MRPCSTCSKETEYRENLPGGKFFCKPQCQRKCYYGLSGIEEDDDDMIIEEDVEKRPEFFGDGLWESLVDFFHNSVVENIDDVSKRLNQLLLELYKRIRVLRLHLDWVEGQRRLKQLKRVLKDVKKEQANFISSNEREIMAIYSEYIRERYLEIDSLLVTMAMIQSKKDLLREELPNHFLYDASPYQESLDLYLEYMEITQKYIDNLKRKFPIFSASYQQVLLRKEEEAAVEEITIERVEVETGMTQEQQDVFDYLEELIIETEKTSKSGDFVVAYYIKNCDVIMHLNLFSFLVAVVSKRDPYLRNVFETGNSLGSNLNDIESRVKEEHNLFESDAYDSLSPHDKVKYGTINWAYSRTGCNQTQGQFGKSYLILSPNVKKRCTYSRYDSIFSDRRIRPYNLGTQETRMCYITNEFTKKQIECMYQYSGGENQLMNTINEEEYMEVQIHGELLFARDVARIMIGFSGDKKIYIEPLLREYFKIIGKDIPYEFV